MISGRDFADAIRPTGRGHSSETSPANEISHLRRCYSSPPPTISRISSPRKANNDGATLLLSENRAARKTEHFNPIEKVS